MREFRGSAQCWAVAMFFVTCAAFFAPASAHAQQGPPIIRSIEVQYSGPATVSKERILAQIRTAVGQPYSDSTVEDDIRSLYKTGTIQNVRIFAQPEGDGVKVIVAVQTRQVLRELVIDGAHRVSAKKLRKEIGVKLNAPVNEGVKGAVSRIHFEGNEHLSERILRKQMKTRGKTMISFVDKSGRLDEV